MKITVEKFIGKKVIYNRYGTQLWGHDKNDDVQMIADVRGWGAIQNLFKNDDGKINVEEAAKFQDELGEWIADAINQKLNQSSKPTDKTN